MKSIISASLIAVLAATVYSPPSLADSVDLHVSVGEVAVGIDIGRPPPAPIVEVVPTPRPGHIWAPGYWSWEGNRHVWVKGTWQKERHGYSHVPGHWEKNGDRWHFEPERWEQHKAVERRAEDRRHDERRAEELRREDHRERENFRDRG